MQFVGQGQRKAQQIVQFWAIVGDQSLHLNPVYGAFFSLEQKKLL